MLFKQMYFVLFCVFILIGSVYGHVQDNNRLQGQLNFQRHTPSSYSILEQQIINGYKNKATHFYQSFANKSTRPHESRKSNYQIDRTFAFNLDLTLKNRSYESDLASYSIHHVSPLNSFSPYQKQNFNISFFHIGRLAVAHSQGGHRRIFPYLPGYAINLEGLFSQTTTKG